MAQEPARWSLRNPHYLRVPGNEWEYQETSRAGKRVIKRFEVPMFLNPADVADQNYPQDGLIIVSHGESRLHPRDIVFIGDPTPDMEPLNEAAEAITESMQSKWVNPIENVNFGDQGFSQSLLNTLSQQLEEAMRRTPLQKVEATSVGQVSADQFAELQKQVATLMEQNARLMAKLGGEEPVESEEPIESPEEFEAPPAPPSKVSSAEPRRL